MKGIQGKYSDHLPLISQGYEASCESKVQKVYKPPNKRNDCPMHYYILAKTKQQQLLIKRQGVTSIGGFLRAFCKAASITLQKKTLVDYMQRRSAEKIR